MMTVSEQILDDRLMGIHRMWKSPSFISSILFDGSTKLLANSCFKADGALPIYQKYRFRDEYSLPSEDIDWWFTVTKENEQIFSYPYFDMLFEKSFWIRCYPQMTSKIIVQFLTTKFTGRNGLFNFLCELDLDDFGNFIRECIQYEYSWKYIQEILDLFVKSKISLNELTLKRPYIVNNNQNELENFCDIVINDNQKSVDDYRKGKTNSINHLKGQVMKLTQGKANIKIVTEILENKLK